MVTTSSTAFSSRSLAYVALFAALMAALGLVPKIDLAFGVPITLQSLGAMLAGCLLGPRRALMALGLFLLGVAMGLPLLSGGRGGPGVFMGPTVGFLFGWMLGAGVTGLVMRALMRRLDASAGWPVLAAAFAASAIGGIVVVYAVGIAGLCLIAHMTPVQGLLSMAVFIPGDLIKCGVCAAVVQTVVRGLPGWRLDRD